MQLQNLYVLALAGLGAASAKSTPPSITTITVAPPNPSGEPCNAPTCVPGNTPCPSAGTTLCEDHIKSCGSPTPTAILTYGGCHDACEHPTYTAPECPSPTNSCTKTGTICEDHLKTCGSPTPTAVLTYGGCHGPCEHPTYTEPACPVPTVTYA